MRVAPLHLLIRAHMASLCTVESSDAPRDDPLLTKDDILDIMAQYGHPQVRCTSSIISPVIVRSHSCTRQFIDLWSFTPRPKVSTAKFAIKSLNIVDLLLPTNNLGRSVSKANFLRIRRAFAQGAKSLSLIMRMVSDSSILHLCTVNSGLG